MTRNIEKGSWKEFLDGLSHQLQDWETNVRVMSENTGAQVMSEGLPFNGLTLDERSDPMQLEIIVGAGTGNHQTHNIRQPKSIAFEPASKGPGGTLDIEGDDGTTTLVEFVRPMPVLAEYARADIARTG